MSRRTSPKYPVVVPGVGPVPALGMIVGEAPGRNEIEEGRPFCGRSGNLLDEALERAGVSRESLFTTNVYKGDVGSGNRNPTADEIADHGHYLDDEIASVRPSAILLLGSVAVGAFGIHGRRMADLVWLRLRVGRLPGGYVFPGYHPAYVLRGGYSRDSWFRDVKRFCDHIRSEG